MGNEGLTPGSADAELVAPAVDTAVPRAERAAGFPGLERGQGSLHPF